MQQRYVRAQFTSRQHRNQRGQAVVETAVFIVVLLMLFMGVYGASEFATDQNTAGTAVRSGARLAAELGNGGYQSGGSNSPSTIDTEVVNVVCEIAAQMPYVSSLDEVDVYRPGANADGSLGSGDLVDKYSCTPTVIGTPSYTLDLRTQTHPNEASLGVRLLYHYSFPAPFISINAQVSAYMVLPLSPKFSG